MDPLSSVQRYLICIQTLHKMDAETAHACDSSNRSGEERVSESEGQHLLCKAWGYPELYNIMCRNIRTNKLINWCKDGKMGEYIDDRYLYWYKW